MFTFYATQHRSEKLHKLIVFSNALFIMLRSGDEIIFSRAWNINNFRVAATKYFSRQCQTREITFLMTKTFLLWAYGFDGNEIVAVTYF